MLKDLLNKVKQNNADGAQAQPAQASQVNANSQVVQNQQQMVQNQVPVQQQQVQQQPNQQYNAQVNPNQQFVQNPQMVQQQVTVGQGQVQSGIQYQQQVAQNPNQKFQVVDSITEQQLQNNQVPDNFIQQNVQTQAFAQGVEAEVVNLEKELDVDVDKTKTRDSEDMTVISKESASMLNLLMEQIKALVEISNTLNDRTKEAEDRIAEISSRQNSFEKEFNSFKEKMSSMEGNMEKFIGLYEIVTNQYNPFLEKAAPDNINAVPQQNQNPNPQANASAPIMTNNVVNELVVAEKIPPFVLSNGKEIKTLQELFEVLIMMDDASFSSYVTEFKNDFSNWIKSSLKDDDLAIKLQPIETRIEMIKALSKYIHKLPKHENSYELKLDNGIIIGDLDTLLDETIYMSDEQFASLVDGPENKIVNWIKSKLNNSELAANLVEKKTKTDFVKELIKYLHSKQ